jgi:hypothetical protein
MLKQAMQRLSLRFAIVCGLLLGGGCGTTRVVFVKTDSDVVRLGPNVSGKVYFRKNGEWVLSKNKVKLPEGWYAGALGDEED